MYSASVAFLRIRRIKIEIKKKNLKTLFCSGISESFVNTRFVKRARLVTYPCTNSVSMTSSDHTVVAINFVIVDVHYQNTSIIHNKKKLGLMEALCSDVILGDDFQTQHKSITFNCGGDKLSLSICGLTPLNISAVESFRNVSSNIKPIITKSLRFSNHN